MVEALLQKLESDERHSNFKVVYRKTIAERQFTDWSMKYIPTSDAVKELLREQGHRSFDPYQFDQNMVLRLLATFQQLREGAASKTGSDASAGGRRAGRAPAPTSNGPGSPAPFVVIAVVVIVFAVVVGVVVF